MCDLRYSRFINCAVKGTFTLCSMYGFNFDECDVTDLTFINCDLSGVDFSGSYFFQDNDQKIMSEESVANYGTRDDLKKITIDKFVATYTRSDGYNFLMFNTDKGIFIKAGCRIKTLEEWGNYLNWYQKDFNKEKHKKAEIVEFMIRSEETKSILNLLVSKAKKQGYLRRKSYSF